ncbi:hypothetical protein bcCo53_001369 (plasmid) [Borrelia coriaceae]|uniref:Uncharacterized protein n=1 Tax=Borrelia coriaceae ATCC 43381 TaxID=1408429 RepID=W5SZ54_9SPIR|nr:hypothetical protein [Borrelia coriaceae]AHH11958.1 hypothetical protein BCO_0018411 [Borrelia coriaceae ATCC 43381]UPA17192.1 hypothetical protein bcCo53_001369 [Borrelia coriaceae]
MLKILLLLIPLFNIFAIFHNFSISEEEYYDHDKYGYFTRKLIRVKDWKTNFNNLKNLGPFFMKDIENIKSKPDKELSRGFEGAFSTSLRWPMSKDTDIVPKEHKPLFEKSYKFIKALKHKNPDQAAYILYEIGDLNAMFTNTHEDIRIFRYLIKHKKLKDNYQYEHVHKKLKDIYYKIRQEYLSTINILEHNDIDNNFNKFMLKFPELHKLVTHLYFNITKLVIHARNHKTINHKYLDNIYNIDIHTLNTT